MTTQCDTPLRKEGPSRRRPGRGLLRGFAEGCRRGLAAALAPAILLASVDPAWAQRRRGEPEANPQFQQDLQAQPGSGAPLGAPMDEPLASPAGSPQSGPGEEPGLSARSVQGVQIGATQARQAPAAPVNPLDARVTVRVKGAPLATFLDTISAQAKVNFIITEGLEAKRVTAFLQNVTVREALQVLLEIKGLTYQQIGKSNTYVVTPRSKSIENVITRIYTLSYIPLIPIGSAASEQASITPTAMATGGGGGAGGGSPGASSSPGGAGPAGGASSAGDGGVSIVGVLTSIMSKSGHVSIEPRTNSIIVTDIPEVFPQVEQIIAELDKKAPQVMIEAQIVEINSSRTKDLGIEWGGSRGELATFVGGQRDTSFPLNLQREVSQTRFFDPVTAVISSIGGGGSDSQQAQSDNLAQRLLFGSQIKSGLLDLSQLRITLRALVARSEARFLGKPKILTLNNKAAVIQVAASTAVSVQQSLSGSQGVAQSGQQVERFPTGLILRVTPQVNKEGFITMLVQPSFTDVQEASVSNANGRIFDPISRGASTLVRIKNGQTLVMGGLLQSNETKVIRKVPVLGYIPIIGWLFTSSSNLRRNTDLVIFLTPTIVSD